MNPAQKLLAINSLIDSYEHYSLSRLGREIWPDDWRLMMDDLTVGHIALFVSDLQAAENFYHDIFAMELIMRETELDDGLWYTLPLDKDWSDAAAAGIELGMVALRRDAFVLALFQGKPAPGVTVLEIGVSMPAAAIAALRDRLPQSVEIVSHEYGDLLFRDPFGYRWHLSPLGSVFQSNGQSSGRWLEV